MGKLAKRILTGLLCFSMVASTLVQAIPTEAAAQLVNVATSATATSDNGSYGSMVVENIIDGNDGTMWQTQGIWPTQARIQLDMGRQISKVVVKLGAPGDYSTGRTALVTVQYAQNGVISDLVDFGTYRMTVDSDYEFVVDNTVSATDIFVTLSDPQNADGSAGGFWPAIEEVEVYELQDETISKYSNIAAQATISVTGDNEGNSSENLVDGSDSTLYKFYNAAMTSEHTITLKYDQARTMDAFRIAFENVGASDSIDFAFTYSLQGKNANDTEYTKIVENATANRTDNSSQTYQFDAKVFDEVQIVMHSCTTYGGSSNGWPAVAEFDIYGSEEVVEDDDSIANGKPVHVPSGKNLAENVNDGSLTSSWKGSYYPSYVDIDLEENYYLDSVEVYTPSNGYSQYTIYTSMDGRNFDKLAEKTSTESCPEEGEAYAANGKEARIVRVYLEYNSASTAAVLNEVRVLGKASGTDVQATPAVNVPVFEGSKYDVEITAQDTYDEVYGIIERQVGAEYKDWFTLELAENPKNNGYDYFELSTVNGKVHVKGNDGVSLATGINHYLKYFCQVNISQVGNQVNMPETIPAIDGSVFKETKAAVRYSYNYCTLSYSMAFYGKDEWRNELDWLALNGVNVVLDATAQEEVWRRFLGELGYSHQEAKDFIAGPAYYAWAYMANLSGFGGPVHDSWFEERTELARENQLSMRKLGMQPVLQGYSGMVPTDIQDYDADAQIIAQGTWCSFQRPAMLVTTSATFEEYAELFYQCQKEVYGDVSDYYATDPFHEGGNTGGMNSADISERVLTEMLTADEDAIWIIQAWQGNPTTALLNGLDRVENGASHALVLDLYAEKTPHNQETGSSYGDTKEFDETPWLYCMLNNFGGRLGMHGHLDNMAAAIPEALNNAEYMAGIGITPEASVNNPVLYEFLFETIWQDDADATVEPIDLDTWLDDYATRRYGAESESANQAWDILKETTYKASLNNLGQGAPESVVNARPALSIGAASTWGNAAISYDKVELEKAAELLLEDYDILKDSEGYLYDVATVLQQVLSNSAQEYQRKMAAAFNSGDLEAFDKYAETFMDIIDDMEKVTSTSEYYLLGRWVEMAKALAKNADDFTKELYELNAKALITTWGSYNQAENGGLKDYSNRQWSGLINDYYKARWERWITARHNELAGLEYESSINWFQWEWTWVRENTVYTTTPTPTDLQTLGIEILENYSSFNQASVADDDITIDKIVDVYAENYQPNNTTEGDPAYVLDGNSGTHWHTVWSDSARDTHYLIFTFDEVTAINGMRLLQRNATNGLISKIDILVRETESGEWTTVVDDAVLDATASTWNRVDFDTVNAKQVKIQVVDAKSGDGSKYAAAAEVRFTAPKEEVPGECEHKNTEEIAAVEATCTTAGTEAKVVCADCGHVVSGGGKINALGHDWSEWIVVEEATTEAAGKEERTCSRCDEKEEQEIPKLNKPGEIVQFTDLATLQANAMTNSEQNPPAWTNDGYASWAFDEEGHWWHSRYDGTPGEGEVANGEASADNPIWIQTGFGKVFNVDHIEYSARGDNNRGIFRDYTVAVANLADPTATPTDDDFTVVKTVEGATENLQTIQLDEAVPATHVRITVSAVTTANSEHYVTAKYLKFYGYEGQAVDPETCKHETTKVVGAKDATCTEAGYTGDTVCAACGTEIAKGEAIPAAGHKAEAVAGKEATCTETGLTEGSKCSVCGEVLTAQETIPAKGHGTTRIEGKADATCTTAGNTGSEICEVCDKVVKVGAVIPALGHDFPETWTVVKEATAEEEGKEERQCTRCDVKEERAIAKLETPECTHKETEIIGAKEATCTEKGHTGDKVCKECKKVVEAGKEIAALGHDWPSKWTVVKEATTKEEGLKERQCTRCDEKQQQTIAKLEDKPSTPSQPTTPSQPAAPSAPATGDMANISSLVMMMLAAACMMLAAKRRKTQ